MSHHFQRAQILMQQSRFDQAETELRGELGLNPENDTAHAQLAACLVALDRKDEAEQEAKQAIGLSPENPFNHYILAHVYAALDREAEAEQAIREAILLDPEDPDYLAKLSNIKLHQGEWQAAVDAADQGLQFDAEHVECINSRAIALTKLGRKDEAGNALGAALHRDPDNAQTHANMGWTQLHSGRPNEAMEYFREALRLDPSMEWARMGIVEAMKARNPVYKWLLAYFLWMSSLSGRTQIILIFGLMFGIRIISNLGEQLGEPFESMIDLLIIGYVAFVFLGWAATPLFNLILRLDKLGRHALSDNERHDSTVFGVSLVGSFALAVTCWSLIGELLPGAVMLAIILSTSVAIALHGWPRKMMYLYVLWMFWTAIETIMFGMSQTPPTLITPEGVAHWQPMLMWCMISTLIGLPLSALSRRND